LVAKEARGRVVGVLAGQQVGVGRGEAEPPAAPALLVFALALGGRRRQRGFLAALDHEADARLAGLAPELGVARLDPPLVVGIERSIARGDAVVRGALEDEQVGGLPRDD